MCQWKNFENRSIIGADMDKGGTFLWPEVYILRWCIQ